MINKNLRIKRISKDYLIRLIRKMKRAIKEKCYDCQGGHKKIDCEDDECGLFEFRPWSKTN